jgi:hypothetical protein
MRSKKCEAGVKAVRRQQRQTFQARVTASWEGGRGLFETRGQVVDFSQSGVGVAIPQPLALDTVVTIQIPNLRLRARGRIRYCRQVRNGFRVGIEIIGQSWSV